MPRPLGRRNPDYEEKKDRLISDLTDFVLRSELTRPSFRQMAMAGAVAEPTLRHYFGDRETVAGEILRLLGERASPLMAAVGQSGAPTAQDAIASYMQLSQAGVAHGAFARAHAFGLVEGVADERVGRAYLEELLEPSLQALESRLSPFLAQDASRADKRAAALMMFAPMLLAVIHQQLLGGAESAPIDLPDLFAAIARHATRAFTAE
jgi:AcrR family transcriptional regulator